MPLNQTLLVLLVTDTYDKYVSTTGATLDQRYASFRLDLHAHLIHRRYTAL
jgi:hypothetical protein